MSLDRALTLLFRNFATCFLLVASLVLPLHVAVSYLHRDVIAVWEIHDDIARFPDDRRVRGVGRAELDSYHAWGRGVLALELAALPVLVAGAARIVERDEQGYPPTVAEAWSAGLREWPRLRPRDGGIALAAGLALAIALLARASLLLLAEPLPDAVAWAGRALAEGLSRALAAPFLLVPAAMATAPRPARSAKGEWGDEPTD